MQVMVINDDPEVQVRVAKGLMSKGFQVVGMESIARACAYVKIDPVDILITGERVGGRLSHTVALAAECANPMVTTMLLTDRTDPEIEELYDLLPSLYALVSPNSDPSLVARLALSAVASPEDAECRMRRNANARQTQPMADWAAIYQGGPAVSTSEVPDRTTVDETVDHIRHPHEEAVETPPEAVLRPDHIDAPFEVHGLDARPVQGVAVATGAHADPMVPWHIEPSEPVAPTQSTTPATLPPAVATIAESFDSAFADLVQAERRMEALQAAALKSAPEGAAPLNPLFALAGQTFHRNDPLPQARTRHGTNPQSGQATAPEIVPARQVRTDWMTAGSSDLDLDRDRTEARSRLHLA